MTGIDWGNVPTWISAIFSICAFGTALWAARAAWKQVKFSADEQKRRDEKDEQEQASKVAAWLVVDEKRKTAAVRYVNNSGVPVYFLTVTPMLAPDRKLLINIAEPGEGPRSVEFDTLADWLRSDADYPARYVQYAGLEVEFLDSNNNIWTRGSNGYLRRSEGHELWNWVNDLKRDEGQHERAENSYQVRVVNVN
ncbi:hypothetical protein [Saccharopolyspora sp. SCSIO 74807]|uniref:hypothetical protein n=1 Tax=Saccharopolyspora sp. SCSIO 74807 TaxID=3118084 RepID=UPI0030D42DFC